MRRSLARAARLLMATPFHDWRLPPRHCNVCGKATVFVCVNRADRWIRMCLRCRSSPKYRAIALVMAGKLGQDLRDLLMVRDRSVYELSTTSGIHRVLRGRPGYVASGYFPDRPMGIEVSPGIWNADVQALPFASQSFDVVISSETFEHVRRPEVGFKEIRRVLKPGGVHCFTVPYREDRPTLRRVDTSGDSDVDLQPRVYHLDPYCPRGALVYTDFGHDFTDLLAGCGFKTVQHKVLEPAHDIQDDLRPVRVFASTKSD